MTGLNRRTTRDLRRGNRTAVLQRLYFDGPLSRQALGPLTGLSSGSISNVVAELVADGLLEEAGEVDSDGGRPRKLLRVAPRSGYLIGVDVGETWVRVELFDLSFAELARANYPLTQGDYDVDRIVEHIRHGICAVLEDSGIETQRLLGVGVGVPGIVDRSADGRAVVYGQAIGWHAVPLEALLTAAVSLPSPVPFFIDNGAKTLGQAEMWFGAGQDARDAVMVLLGSGVGACVVTGGSILDRPTEWGHTNARVGGRTCRCGARGCLEAYVGAEALLQQWREAGGTPAAGDDQAANLAALLAAGGSQQPPGEGGAAAARLLDEAAAYLAAGVADLVNLFSPELVVVGGWAGLLLGPELLPAVRRHVSGNALSHLSKRVGVELGRLGTDAVTMGAATLPLADLIARGGHPYQQQRGESRPATRRRGDRPA